MRHSRKADRHKENGVPANAGTPLSSICSFILTHNHRSPVRIRPQAPKKQHPKGCCFFIELVRSRSLSPLAGEIRPQAPKKQHPKGCCFFIELVRSRSLSPLAGEIRPQAPKKQHPKGCCFFIELVRSRSLPPPRGGNPATSSKKSNSR